MQPTIEVLPALPELIERGLEISLKVIEQAITERGQATLALAGGSTPKPLYEALARQQLSWDKLQIFWGDERYVPADHPDSNEGMARGAWLDQVPIPAANIHPVPTHYADPAEAAQAYDQALRSVLGSAPGKFPALDLILLGMGPDGHTASLFPHTDALQVCDRLVTVGNKDGQPRISFTVPLINQARHVLFMVTGANKQTALEHIFAEAANPLDYPARFIQPEGELIWLLDTAAAATLKL
ncbi:MAG: 6-phosphogluconolactonase [Aphanocapsa sp. GSE-SYN-MK-11-07L]|nr:6-phosphogluconolactonase [Aphanocapsa sp. GSE-SYN-MK-11-07L]